MGDNRGALVELYRLARERGLSLRWAETMFDCGWKYGRAVEVTNGDAVLVRTACKFAFTNPRELSGVSFEVKASVAAAVAKATLAVLRRG